MPPKDFKHSTLGKSVFYESQIKGIFICFFIGIIVSAGLQNAGAFGYFIQTFTALISGGLCVFVAWSINGFKRPTDRSYRTALLIALIAYLAGQIPKLTKTQISREQVLESELMQFATEYKKSLPITNADGSEIFDAEYGRFFIRIKTVLKNIKITEVDIASFDYSMRSAYDATCEDTGTKKALLNGIDFLYAYYDQDKSLISEHSLTAFCGKRAK